MAQKALEVLDVHNAIAGDIADGADFCIHRHILAAHGDLILHRRMLFFGNTQGICPGLHIGNGILLGTVDHNGAHHFPIPDQLDGHFPVAQVAVQLATDGHTLEIYEIKFLVEAAGSTGMLAVALHTWGGDMDHRFAEAMAQSVADDGVANGADHRLGAGCIQPFVPQSLALCCTANRAGLGVDAGCIGPSVSQGRAACGAADGAGSRLGAGHCAPAVSQGRAIGFATNGASLGIGTGCFGPLVAQGRAGGCAADGAGLGISTSGIAPLMAQVVAAGFSTDRASLGISTSGIAPLVAQGVAAGFTADRAGLGFGASGIIPLMPQGVAGGFSTDRASLGISTSGIAPLVAQGIAGGFSTDGAGLGIGTGGIAPLMTQGRAGGFTADRAGLGIGTGGIRPDMAVDLNRSRHSCEGQVIVFDIKYILFQDLQPNSPLAQDTLVDLALEAHQQSFPGQSCFRIRHTHKDQGRFRKAGFAKIKLAHQILRNRRAACHKAQSLGNIQLKADAMDIRHWADIDRIGDGIPRYCFGPVRRHSKDNVCFLGHVYPCADDFKGDGTVFPVEYIFLLHA